MTNEPIKATPIPAVSRTAKWSPRLVVCSLLFFFCPCLLPLMREWFMELSGAHVHPHSELFSAILVGCVAVGVLMNVAAVVLGILSLREIRTFDGQLAASKPTKAAIGGASALLVLVALGTPLVLTAREAANRTQCRCYMKQLGLAMHNYHDMYGSFPLAATHDAEGRPLLSWRVLILPYLDRQDLYNRFHLDEPWDSPHNLPLASEMPEVYRCLSDRRSKPNCTTYVAVIGDETMFPPHGTVRREDVKDGTSTTVMIGEIAASRIVWSKPEDLIFDEKFVWRGNFSSAHPRGWNVLMGDGTCRFIDEKTDPRILRALMTIDGGEPVSYKDF